MPGRELISRRTKNEFREAFSGWGTLRTIEIAFDNEGFVPDLTYHPEISGQRRTYVEQYYSAIDFTNPSQVFRLLRVFEDLIIEIERSKPDGAIHLRLCLERDGYRFDNGRLVLKNPNMRFGDVRSVAEKIDAAGIITQVERIEASIENDPSLAIGTAKELIESCCKTILTERGIDFDRNDDLPKLIRKTLKELKLLPEDIPEQARGSDIIRRMVSNLASVLNGLAEMRNLYGSGHGHDGKHRGLAPRHAKLAAGAASTLATFLFETYKEK